MMEPYQYVLLFFVICMGYALARVIIEMRTLAAKEKRRREISKLLNISKTLKECSEHVLRLSDIMSISGDALYAFSEACDSFVGIAKESGEAGDLIQVKLPTRIYP